jgi:hypothetical protein
MGNFLGKALLLLLLLFAVSRLGDEETLNAIVENFESEAQRETLKKLLQSEETITMIRELIDEAA